MDATRCSPNDTAQMCESRRIAVRSGDMMWNQYASRGRGVAEKGGWLYPVLHQGTRAALPFFRWTFCPFCGEVLPEIPAPPTLPRNLS